MNGVFFGEFFGERNMEGVEFVEGILDDLGVGGVVEKEVGFGVFDGFGFVFFEGLFGVSIVRFFNLILVDVWYRYVFDYCRVLYLFEYFDFGYCNMFGFIWF